MPGEGTGTSSTTPQSQPIIQITKITVQTPRYTIKHTHFGAVAQLGERIVRNDEVGGSNPPSSTKSPPPPHLRVARQVGIARRSRVPTSNYDTRLPRNQLFSLRIGLFGRILLAVTYDALLGFLPMLLPANTNNASSPSLHY